MPARPFPTLGLWDTFKQSKLVKIIMKTIAILALTAAALVSCQQQQQQQQVTENTTPAEVVTTKK